MSKQGFLEFFKPPTKRVATTPSTGANSGIAGTSTSSTTASTTAHLNQLATDKKPDEHLKGDEYIFLILRLLYSVSNSVICQKSLTTPKWLTLLLLIVGCGNFGVQRRLFRLLRRLLSKISPIGLKAYVPTLMDLHMDLLESETPLDDEEVIYWMSDQNNNNTNNTAINNQQSVSNNVYTNPQTSDSQQRLSSAKKLIEFFLDCITAMVPTTATATNTSNISTTREPSSSSSSNEMSYQHSLPFISRLSEPGLIQLLSAECLFTLRKLQTIPLWKDVVNTVVQDSIQAGMNVIQNNRIHRHMSLDTNSTTYSTSILTSQDMEIGFKKAIASLSVLGAHIDRIRPGGFVNLKLHHPSETIANKIGNSFNRGIVVMQSSTSTSSGNGSGTATSSGVSSSSSSSSSSNSTNAVEVLFLEKESSTQILSTPPFCIQEEYGSSSTSVMSLSPAVTSLITQATQGLSQPDTTTTDLLYKHGECVCKWQI